jgi:hypothetical protein
MLIVKLVVVAISAGPAGTKPGYKHPAVTVAVTAGAYRAGEKQFSDPLGWVHERV